MPDALGNLRAAIRQQLDYCLVETDFPLGPRYRGKVRDTYRLSGDRLLLITTDRISAFDHVLPQPIPFKGQILNGIAARAFEDTREVAPNHVLAVPDPNVTLARACDPFPVEFVVRGYLAGHAWRVYRDGGRDLCGERLPDGIHESERLPQPLLTPATKATEGHDEDISRQQIVARGLMTAEDLDQVSDLSLRLFARGSELAAERGLLLVDTKYEFGRGPDGQILLIDEVHTPDSSRYYYAEGYEERLAEDAPQRQLSKEFVREWLIDQGFQGRPGESPPNLPAEFREEVSERYAELYAALTGVPFRPDRALDPGARIWGVISELQ
jgi:phosphoribosylaminoimidazole-succinocarboxamide synthase